MAIPDLAGLTAADLMLRSPKTLPGSATVQEVREVLANPRVQLVLLADGTVFRGALTTVPAGARDDEHAVGYATAAETIRPEAPGAVAFERANASAHRRLVVLGEDDELLGLVCLNSTRTGFCKSG
jgi:CBS domain-containing protein